MVPDAEERLSELRRLGTVTVVPEPPPRTDEVASAGVADEPPEVPRPDLREVTDVFLADGPDDVDVASEPLAPADPEVSAKANAGEATAAPTPNATASAPTRPM